MALRDGWLVGQLLGQIRALLDRLDAGQALPAEVRTTLADLTTLASVAEPLPPPPVKALPWLLRVEQVLLGDWSAVTDGQVRCPACGSDQVGHKSATPRVKKYIRGTDEAATRETKLLEVMPHSCGTPVVPVRNTKMWHAKTNSGAFLVLIKSFDPL